MCRSLLRQVGACALGVLDSVQWASRTIDSRVVCVEAFKMALDYDAVRCGAASRGQKLQRRACDLSHLRSVPHPQSVMHQLGHY